LTAGAVPRQRRTRHSTEQKRLVTRAALLIGTPQWAQFKQARNAVRRVVRALFEALCVR
jgi:hypothetical protein